jgi:hypothetical protein
VVSVRLFFFFFFLKKNIYIYICFYSHANINYESTSPWHIYFFIVNLQMYASILFHGVLFVSFFIPVMQNFIIYLVKLWFWNLLVSFYCFHD